MKSISIALGALLLAHAAAQPHRHQHRDHHRKRALEVVWETDWVYVTETVNVVTTIWVDPNASTTLTTTASNTAQPGEFYETSPIPPPAVPTTSSAVVSNPPPPPPPAPTTLATSVSVAPAPVEPTKPAVVVVPTYVAPVIPTPSAAPVVPTTPPAPVVPTPSEAPVVVAVAAPTTTAPAVAAVQTPTSSTAASSGAPSVAGGVTGKATFYDTADSLAAPGSCGFANDGTKEMVLAFPAGVMGAQSNGNPYCGKMVSISYGGKTITAKIVDKCPGCANTAIDLSRAAFNALAHEDLGHIQVTWAVIN